MNSLTHTPSPPPFYEQLDAFLEAIPQAPKLEPCKLEQQHPLLQNYLKVYGLDELINESERYAIWQSSIRPDNSDETFRIVQQYWCPKESKGIWVVAHGYLDHTGFYGRIIRWALANNYAVFCFDLPGHGLSSGERVAISHFSDYSDILHQLLQQPLLDKESHKDKQPLYAIGQSTGCAIISDLLLSHKYSFEHVVLLAPLIRIHFWPALRYVYHLFKPWLSSVRRSRIPSSHDSEFTAFLHHNDPLQHWRIPLRWLGAMDEWYQLIKKTRYAHNEQAMSIIQGSSDTTVDWRYNLHRFKQLFPHSSQHMIAGARHHLVKESADYWQQVEPILNDWVQQQTSRH